jgi:O-antigen/teichoic acid export membrane protein
MSALRRQIFHSSLGTLAVKAVFLVLQFSISVILARLLGVAGFGIYAFALAVATLLIIPAQLGFSGYLVRMVAIYQARRELGLLKGLLIRSSQFAVVASLVTAGICAAAVALFHGRPGDSSYTTLMFALCMVPFLSLIMVSGGVLRGLGNVVVSHIPEQTVRPFLLLLLLLYARGVADVTPEKAMVANLGATVVALGFGVFLLKSHLPELTNSEHTKKNVQEWLLGALPFMLLAGSQVINHQADILLLGVLSTVDDVGQYRVAVQMADAMVVVLMAITASITPHLASLHSKSDWQTIQQVLVSAHRSGMAILVPLAFLFALGGKAFLEFVFGAEFGEASGAVTILASGKALYAGIGFCGIALSMFGFASVATVVTLLTALLNIALNLLLIPSYGIEGAAVATSASLLTVNVALAIWMKLRFGFNVTASGATRSSRSHKRDTHG